MPLGMLNAPATFQQMINHVIAGLDGYAVYLGDIVKFSHSWEQHTDQLHCFLHRLQEAKLTVNLMKTEFCHAKVGYIVGQGQVSPVSERLPDFQYLLIRKT